MIRRIYQVFAVAGILTMVGACGVTGTNGATATVISGVNQTITANFQATRTASVANTQATATGYAQSATRTASGRAATLAGPRGASGIGAATGSAATPGSTAARTTSTPGVTPTFAQPLPAATAFRDPAGRFSFLIPPGWSVQQSPTAGVVVTVVSVTPRGSANVATERATGTQTLDEYTAATVATIQREHAGYRVAAAGVQPATLGTYPARRYEIADGNGGAGVRFVQYVTLVGTTAYVLTLTSADSDSASFLDQARVLVDTFAFGAAPDLTLGRRAE